MSPTRSLARIFAGWKQPTTEPGAAAAAAPVAADHVSDLVALLGGEAVANRVRPTAQRFGA